jgi:hypothetical protein
VTSGEMERAKTENGNAKMETPSFERGDPSPPGVFSEVFILKGFKSCVLEVRILNELQAGFAEVRILKGIDGRGGERLTC